MNRAVNPASASVSRASVLEAAALCSTIAAFCCVIWSNWFTAVFTSDSPVACSPAEAAISLTIAATSPT